MSIFKNFFSIYFWCTGSSLLHMGFCLVEAGGSYSLVVMCGLLIALAYFVVNKAQGEWALVVSARGLSSYGIWA